MGDMLLLPQQLRDNLIAFIQTNPSPNVPVGQCMQLIEQLQRLSTFGKPAVVSVEESSPESGKEEKMVDG